MNSETEKARHVAYSAWLGHVERMSQIEYEIEALEDEAAGEAARLGKLVGVPPPDWGDDWFSYWWDRRTCFESASDEWKKEAIQAIRQGIARKAALAKLNKNERKALGIVV